GIKSVAGLQDEKLILLYRNRWLDVGMITVETVRIVFAMVSGLSDDNGSWTLHITRIGPRCAPNAANKQECDGYSRQGCGFHRISPLSSLYGIRFSSCENFRSVKASTSACSQ